MNKNTVYTEFMHSKTVYLTFNLKRMIFQSLESEKNSPHKNGQSS